MPELLFPVDKDVFLTNHSSADISWRIHFTLTQCVFVVSAEFPSTANVSKTPHTMVFSDIFPAR
jgi:hypothetical protein